MQQVSSLPLVLAQRQAEARPIAVVRILVGLAAIGNAFEHWAALNRLLAPLVVKMPYLSWLPYPPAAAAPALIGAWLIAAMLFMVGFRTRVAGGVLVAILAYVLLLDQQLYSNHLYLNVLVVLLVTIADSGARYSLDAHYRGRRGRIAEWPLLLLKIQVSIVYFFAALMKVNPDYLSGDLMLSFIHADVLKRLPPGLPAMGVVQALAIASVAVEFFLAFALWFAGWRWLALAAGLALHLSIILTGGAVVGVPDIPFTVFALLVMAPYILFFQLPAPRPASAPSDG
jgi:hypothetical protein